jgi:Methylamine utilisation protein MauE
MRPVLVVGSQAGTALEAIPAGLLLAAGIAKLAPGAQARAGLAAAGLPGWTTRPLGCVEAALAIACLVRPSTPALAAMAALYAGFAAYTGARLARGDGGGCGCLWGDEQLDPVHVAVNVSLAAVAAAAAWQPPPSLVRVAAHTPIMGAALVTAVACAVYCLVLVLRHLSDAVGAYAPGRAGGR